jgi:hypothetical protein
MHPGACGPNTKDSWPIGRIEGEQRMYDCYGKYSTCDSYVPNVILSSEI